jgi:curved DNA-binding protein CbpA
LAGTRDYYATLGVARSATSAEIRRAFRRLALTLHPDVNDDDVEAEARFKQIARAYATLSDPAKRRRYDLRGGGWSSGRPEGPASFEVAEGPIYHSDLGRDSDFYGPGDPLTVAEVARVIDRDRSWIRRTIREGRLPAQHGRSGYLIRLRDAQRLDRSAARRRGRTA